MTMPETGSPSKRLPLTQDLRLAYVGSLIVAILMAIVSAAGLLYQAEIYPQEELVLAFVPNDVVNLCIGLPILLGSMWFARRGALIGLLFWPGALFYVLYNYIVYVFAMPLNMAFPIYLALLALSVYTLIGLVAGIDAGAVGRQLAGVVPERLCGGVLAVLGTLFCLRAISVMLDPITSQAPVAETEIGPLVTDFLTAPALVIGGALLWRRKPLGYVTGGGLLFQSSMLFIGLIIWLFLQPTLTSASFSPIDTVVVFILGLPCFIALALFMRGVVSKRGSSSA